MGPKTKGVVCSEIVLEGLKGRESKLTGTGGEPVGTVKPRRADVAPRNRMNCHTGDKRHTGGHGVARGPVRSAWKCSG